MDDRLKSALEVANLMVTFNNQKELIKQEYNESCLYHENGHRFAVNKELINFLNTLLQMGHDCDIVILDDFETPYMIADVKEFYDKIFNIYIEVSNRYYQKYIEMKKNRSISKMIGL
jgi:hypothetical protein